VKLRTHDRSYLPAEGVEASVARVGAAEAAEVTHDGSVVAMIVNYVREAMTRYNVAGLIPTMRAMSARL
jgi:hypothetical protein